VIHASPCYTDASNMSPVLVRALGRLHKTGLCLSCLAAAVELGVEETREQMATVSGVIKVKFLAARCDGCHEPKTVVTVP
jgi:hypothetical protein